MTTFKQVLASALFVLGVALVFLGLTATLGFAPGGIVASLGAIAALLYAGAVWFGSPARRSASGPTPDPNAPSLFDASGRLLCGPAAGQPVASLFDADLRREIDLQCAAALAGTPARFTCMVKGASVVFDVLPVRAADGTIRFGVVVRTNSRPTIGAAPV